MEKELEKLITCGTNRYETISFNCILSVCTGCEFSTLAISLNQFMLIKPFICIHRTEQDLGISDFGY